MFMSEDVTMQTFLHRWPTVRIDAPAATELRGCKEICVESRPGRGRFFTMQDDLNIIRKFCAVG